MACTHQGDRDSYQKAAAGPGVTIELIVWHHKRRTRRQPYSAAAYLLDPSKDKYHKDIEAGECLEAGSEGEAARDALRDLQESLATSDLVMPLELAHEVLIAALGDPVGAIGERRFV